MKISGSITTLAKALTKAQKSIENAKREHTARVQSKKGDASSYTYNYADLASVMEVVRDPLADNGLSIVQIPISKRDDLGYSVSVTTILLHDSGEFIEADPLELRLADGFPQTVGSGITYARRYSLTAIVGVAFETDDDGQHAQGMQNGEATTAPREFLPACPACGKGDVKRGGSVIVGKAEFGGGLVCWKNKDGCGHEWETEQHPFVGNKAARKEKPAKGHAQPPAEGFSSIGEELEARMRQEQQARSRSEPQPPAPLPQKPVPGQLGFREENPPAPSVEKNAQAMQQSAKTPPPLTEQFRALLIEMGCRTAGDAQRVISFATNKKYQFREELAKDEKVLAETLQTLKEQQWTLKRVDDELRAQQAV